MHHLTSVGYVLYMGTVGGQFLSKNCPSVAVIFFVKLYYNLNNFGGYFSDGYFVCFSQLKFLISLIKLLHSKLFFFPLTFVYIL